MFTGSPLPKKRTTFFGIRPIVGSIPLFRCIKKMAQANPTEIEFVYKTVTVELNTVRFTPTHPHTHTPFLKDKVLSWLAT